VGSDVPFFLRGGCCLATGRGERLEALPAVPLWLVVAAPERRVFTSRAYAALGRGASRGRRPALTSAVRRTVEAVRAGEPAAVGASLHNDFASVEMAGLVEARAARDDLLASGCLGASISGSGSSAFGVAADRQTAERITKQVRERWPWVQVARTLQPGEGMVISEWLGLASGEAATAAGQSPA